MQFEPMATEILTAEMKKDIDLSRSKFMIKKTTLNPYDNINLNEGPVSPVSPIAPSLPLVPAIPAGLLTPLFVEQEERVKEKATEMIKLIFSEFLTIVSNRS